MESYIVRIYRQPAAASGMVGTIEAAATGRRKTFHSQEELLEALSSSARPGRGHSRSRSAAGKR